MPSLTIFPLRSASRDTTLGRDPQSPGTRPMRLARSLLLSAALLAFAAPAAAQQPQGRGLVVNLSGPVSSIDPHFHNFIPNNNVAEHIFEKLTRFDADGKLVPGLATEWRAVEPDLWEFKLRPGVKFHDGSPLTAEDVAFTLTRAAKVPNSPGPFTPYIRGIRAVETPDPATVRLRLSSPNSLLPYDLSTIFVVSRKAGESAATEDYNSGKAAVGTGPFRFASFERGEAVTVVRNDEYWGEKPAWAKVTFKIVTKPPTRIAGLLAGEADVIEAVSTPDAARLSTDKGFQIVSKPSTRLIYIFFDQERDQSPFVTDAEGKKLDRNPLKDPRVRRAMSMALNRDGIRDRLMAGFALPAGQLVPEGVSGHVGGLGPDRFDPDGAKKLLAEAGYPDGFTLTLHGTNDRYVNDAEILQAVAGMWRRIGVRTQVEVMPFATMATQVRGRAVSAYMVGLAAVTGDATAQLRTLVMTYDVDRGTGVLNYGRYSDPEVDRAISGAFAATNEGERLALVADATKRSMGAAALLPIHFQVTIWGAKAGLDFKPRVDEYTLAHEIRPK